MTAERQQLQAPDNGASGVKAGGDAAVCTARVVAWDARRTAFRCGMDGTHLVWRSAEAA